MREIEQQAAEAWVPYRHAQARPQAAWDYLSVVIPPNPRRELPPGERLDAEMVDAEAHEEREEFEEGDTGQERDADASDGVVSRDAEELDAEVAIGGSSGVVADVEMHSRLITGPYERGRGRGGRGRERGRGGRGFHRGGGGRGRGTDYRGSGDRGGRGRGHPRVERS